MNASRSAVVILSIFVTISRACPPQKILRSPDSNRLASTGIPDAGGLVFLSGEEEAAIASVAALIGNPSVPPIGLDHAISGQRKSGQAFTTGRSSVRSGDEYVALKNGRTLRVDCRA